MAPLLLALLAGWVQDPRAAQQESVRQQMLAIEKQRASLRAQMPAAPTDSFFTVPWSAPVAPVMLTAATPACDPVPPEQIGSLVEEIAGREGLTPDLLRAVIEKESAYLPCAVSEKGAQGLMQLMPATAAGLGVSDAFDPRQNVDAGARFLRQMLQRYGGNLVLALAAYNAGPGRVDSVGGVPAIPETLNYVTDILGRLQKSRD